MDFFFFKQKTAYGMRISNWSSDVCSSDLREVDVCRRVRHVLTEEDLAQRLAAQGRRRATGVRMRGQERDLRLYALAMTVERKQFGRGSCRDRVLQYV